MGNRRVVVIGDPGDNSKFVTIDANGALLVSGDVNSSSAINATVTVIASNSADEQGVAATSGLVLLGFDVTESAGSAAAAEVILRHGTSTAGPMLAAPINLDANGCTGPIFFAYPVACASGIFIDRVSGSSTVVLYTDVQ